jgi:methionine sulfoxide reductase catalytic subunit
MFLLKNRGFIHPVASDITPRAVYQSRRQHVQGMAAAAAGVMLTPCQLQTAQAASQRPGQLAALGAVKSAVPGAMTMEKLTAYKDMTEYNNYYEFGTDKADPAVNGAPNLKTRPWAVTVEGLVKKPKVYGIEELLKLAPLEERIYRLRCVEGWSMVIPWVGYSLSELIRRCEPTGSAKYIEFITLADSQQMPGLKSGVLRWPYTEGLRLDEAMNPLALLCFGLYGEVLPGQNGAPVRLVMPWKYGFKSAKSIVKIRFVEKQPQSSWMQATPGEYGFYSNVNPNVDHPRWSQASERRIGETGLFQRKKPTLIFNGYEAQVGQLYTGMDLKKNF